MLIVIIKTYFWYKTARVLHVAVTEIQHSFKACEREANIFVMHDVLPDRDKNAIVLHEARAEMESLCK